MRQIGSLPKERDAQRFAAYLVTQGITTQVEPDTHDWAIWVRDENNVQQARELLEQFRVDPNDRRYQGAERQAEAIRREAAQQRVAAQKNVIEMRGRWGVVAGQRIPLTMTLIALSVLVTFFGEFGKATKGFGRTINEQLFFVGAADYVASQGNPLASVSKGELWRAVTPIFIHLTVIHLAFNMIWFFQLGRMIETLRGTARLAIFILLIAALSSLAQAIAPSDWGGTPRFGGMSGVVYGLFGYAWMKSLFDTQPGFQLGQSTVIVMLGWLFLCMTPAIPDVANVAHVVGLVVGIAAGYLPTLLKH